MLYLSLAAVLAAAPLPAAAPVVLEQLVSRHDPAFDVAAARLAVGRDGHVYLASGGSAPTGGAALRLSADGRVLAAGRVGYSTMAVAAGPDGTVATAEGHFARRVAFHTPAFVPAAEAGDFLASDALEWIAPADVAAGPSGDFYAVDQNRLRVLRLTPAGRVVAAVPLDRLGERPGGSLVGLRVDEPNRRLVTAWQKSGTVWAVGFDGTPLWKLATRPAGERVGGFDLDADGNLYLLAAGTDAVRVFDPAGKPTGEVRLRPGAEGVKPVTELRVLGRQLVVKRADPRTLFEVYDRQTGDLVRRVRADVEELTVRYPSPVWTAGTPVPFAVRFDPGSRPTKPAFRAFVRPLGVPEFAELPLVNGAVTPPADARGLYQVRVTPDVGGRVCVYVADGIVEVRTPGAGGSVSVFTPLNRFYYGRGEDVPATVLVRAGPGVQPPTRVTLRLVGKDGRAVAELPCEVAAGRGTVTVGGSVTAGLEPGRYRLDADVPGFTVAPQHLEVGPGLRERPRFAVTQYGDYELGFPRSPRLSANGLPDLPDLPDAVADHLSRSTRLGLNRFADRLGHPSSGLGTLAVVASDAALTARLAADPVAVSPEKAAFEGAVRRTVAGYGANGIEEHPIFLYMDAGLPVGTLFDARKPEQMDADLTGATEALRPYPAFRGWSWAANWWQEKTGADAAASPAEATAYAAALKAARETGAWAAVLDTVSDRTFGHAAAAGRRFRAVLDRAAPGKVAAATGPYRAVAAHPPVAFAAADEVDLQYQAEQIQPPQVAPHNVDFYKRPGQPAWGHPELWNDDGTGGMVLPTLFQMAMRGANGVGRSGPVGPWAAADPTQSDPRNGIAGAASVQRAAAVVLGRYGAWNAKLENADRVAVVVSTRMQRIETWDGKIGGAYFDALYEAYNACLYAHRPASFVFVEDLKPDTLKKYQAVLVVRQRVTLDPPLAAALKDAAAGGVRVFHDGTCRPELVKGFTPFGVSFDRVTADPSAWQDDSAYDRFPRYFKAHAEVLRKVLGPVVRPVAACSNPEVLLTERRGGAVRYVWAVNNTLPGWEPGQAWRVGLLMTQRVPVVESLTLDVPAGGSVVDLFAGKTIPAPGGRVACDLRSLPARLFAILPRGTELPPELTAEPVVESLFGPHVRDVVVSPDGSAAMVNCFNWDDNLYGLDPATGDTRWGTGIGHAFAFDPRATAAGFFAQGYDVRTAEGYHLYRLGSDGKAGRRFALWGLPQRATLWADAGRLKEVGLNAFATPPGGGWVAAGGNLGLAVWDADGRERWADSWWKNSRKHVRLLAANDDELIVVDGQTVVGREARTGKTAWSVTLPVAGEVRVTAASRGGGTVVLGSDALGGRLYVIRGGKLVNTVPVPADELAVSADGSFVAATAGRQLRVVDPLGGLVWTYTGDDLVRRPRISPDGQRVAVGTDLGTLAVLERGGRVVATRDLGALPVPAWLSGGDLLVGTWAGKVARFGPGLEPRWERRLAVADPAARRPASADDRTPTTRSVGWGNATPTPLRLEPNLLAETKPYIAAVFDPAGHESTRPLGNPVELLTDGQPTPPPRPWLGWTDIAHADSGFRDRLTLRIDTYRTQLQVTGITFVEDPAHPESWLRDVKLQWWDVAADGWRDGPTMLSNATVHSHRFEKPVEAARFRLVASESPTWPVGNVRLGELVFHGRKLGCSHPDAAGKRPVAVLFDESETDVATLRHPSHPFTVRVGGAFSGVKCLELSTAGSAGPEGWDVRFLHTVPNWDFEIAEQPKPGQYRYLQFAWKAKTAETTGIGLMVGPAGLGGVRVLAGDVNADAGETTHRAAESPPTEWTVVRVDLWAAGRGRLSRVQTLTLRSAGGGALFDRILLGRTAAELPATKPNDLP